MTDADGFQFSTELQWSKHGDLALSERTVEQFCRASVSPVTGNVPSPAALVSPATTMFFRSSGNSCCGSVTVKSKLQELRPAVGVAYPDAPGRRLQDVEGMERRQEFLNQEPPFETSFYDSLFTCNRQNETICSPRLSHELDFCAGLLPTYASCCHDAVPSSVDMASLGTVLSPSQLPAPVRGLLTPPDSLSNSPTDEDTMTIPDEAECPAASGPDDIPLENNGLLVLTPVTRKPRRTHPGCTTIKYNRKNSSELERRRIHFCTVPG